MKTPTSKETRPKLLHNGWFWTTGVSGIANLVLLSLYPYLSNLTQTRHQYVPKSGYLTSVIPTPTSLVATSGWIDPQRIQNTVRTALQAFGTIDPEKISPLTNWEDVTLTQYRYWGWGGELVTFPALLPARALNRIPEAASKLEIDADSKISIAVRYWTDKYEGEDPPGLLHLSVELRQFDEQTKTSRPVIQPPI
jgi:hypothetical protein